MGYTTEFDGEFRLSRRLTEAETSEWGDKFGDDVTYSDFDDHGQVVLSKLNPKQRDMFEDTVRGPRAVVSAAKAKEIAP